jgi:hypothetical protein
MTLETQMRKFTVFSLLAAFLLLSAVPGLARPEQVEVIQLTKSKDIRLASTMNQALDIISNRVMECIRDKLAPSAECFCLYPKELSDLKKVYDETLKKRPEWKNRAVLYTSEGKTHLVSFDGVNRQLAVKCPQPN